MSDGNSSSRTNRIVSNKYQILGRLGEGGMGEVYQAVHLDIGRPFAIKFLHPHLARNGEFVDRFQQEARSAGALVDENIVSVTDFGVAEDGAPYLVMELLEGDSLAALLARTPVLPVPRAAYITIQACRGLAVAHAKHIVHRDIKPENIFICRRNDGTDLVKLLDFGIAKLRTGAGVTKTGTTMGTPLYMSPEQARGAKCIDQRTDIYSLGVILYEMLSGAKAHAGDEYHAILYDVLHREPESLGQHRRDLPPALVAIVMRAMARAQEARFPSAVELSQALVPFAGRTVTPLSTRAVTPPTVATSPSPMSSPALAASASGVSRVPQAAKARRRGRLAIVAGLAAVVAVVVIAAVVLRPGARRPPQPPMAPPSVAPLAAPAAPSNGLAGGQPQSSVPIAAEPARVAPPTVASTPPSPPTAPHPGGRPGGHPRSMRPTSEGAPGTAQTSRKPAQANPEPELPGHKAARAIDRNNPFND